MFERQPLWEHTCGFPHIGWPDLQSALHLHWMKCWCGGESLSHAMIYSMQLNQAKGHQKIMVIKLDSWIEAWDEQQEARSADQYLFAVPEAQDQERDRRQPPPPPPHNPSSHIPPPPTLFVNHKHLKGPPGQNIPHMLHSMSVSKDQRGRKLMNE